MGCIVCKKGKTKTGSCDVCVIVDGDNSSKFVKWCSFCKAWICNVCRPKYTKRAIAALKRRK